jgi:hypothetical protein
MLDKMIEGVDYEMIPSGEGYNEQAWDVRILRGDFVETVVRFGNIAFNAESDCINFNFMVISSPGGIEEDDADLQQTVGAILETLLEEAARDGSLVLGEPEGESED